MDLIFLAGKTTVHWKMVLFSAQLFVNWVSEGTMAPAHICQKGVPADAVFVRGFFDPRRNVFSAIFEHESFEPVDLVEGADLAHLLPIVDVVLKTVNPDDQVGPV
jgi:hypothetical protein